MNKVELKVTYNRMRYAQGKMRTIDWSNPCQKDIEFNSKIQKSIAEWKKSLTQSELTFVRGFEQERMTQPYSNLRKQSRKLVNNFVKVEYRGGGWYVFSPSAHKWHNRNDELRIQGFHKMSDVLKQYGKWSFCGKKVVGF